ncbi:MAG: alpha/beta hydrolase [Cyclobacteriaceae bacterium]|nr:MAG: alpha/beta hydrolase [Cyclobacteriaceae bacterium]
MRYIVQVIVLFVTASFCSGQNLHSYTSDGLTLYYEQHGSGPALYILSGGPGEYPGQSYRQLADSLKNWYTCVIVHQRGSGKSRNILINENTISIARYTDDLERLRQHRGDKQIALLGVSWGGLLAMNYTAQYSKFVSHIILVCSAPPSYKLWNVLYDNQFARRSAVELDSLNRLQQIFSGKTERELDSLKRADSLNKIVLAYKEFILIHVRAMYHDRSKISRKMYEGLFYEFNFQPIPIIDKEVLETKFDITDKLKKLKTPALIVYGRQDDQGESTFYMQQECFRNSEMHVIEQCGHEIMEEQQEAFYRILLGYVKKMNSKGN